MPKVIVLRGPCGGGKTKIANEIHRIQPEFEHIELDVIKKEISGSTSCDDGLHEAALWFSTANQETRELLDIGKSVILDEAFADPYLLQIALMGISQYHQVYIIEILYSPEEHIRRYATKETKIHQSEDVILHHINAYKAGGYGKTPHTHIKGIVNDLSLPEVSKSAQDAAKQILEFVSE